MKTNTVQALIERMKSDTSFRERVLTIDDVDARMALINKEGYECKVGDVQLYLRHYNDKDRGQVVVLTDKGGCNGIYYGFCF